MYFVHHFKRNFDPFINMVIVNYRYDTNMQNVVFNQFKIRCPHLNMQAMALKTCKKHPLLKF
jgi:hypothetical protein